MGMFDYVFCKKQLPLTEELLKTFPDTDWSAQDFQTKDFHNSMSKYIIEEDGKIFCEKIFGDYIEDPPEVQKEERKKGGWYMPFHFVETGRERIVHWYHGAVNFYHLLNDKEGNSWWIEFEALFTKGELTEITLKEARISTTAEQNAKNAEELKQRMLAHKNDPVVRARQFLDKVTFGYWRKSWRFIAKKIHDLGDGINKISFWISCNLP